MFYTIYLNINEDYPDKYLCISRTHLGKVLWCQQRTLE